MSNENNEKDLAGTANALRQQSVYRELSEIYTPEGANLLASVNLKRNGVDVPPEGVGHWNTVNEAAHAGKMDLEAEAAIAAAKVNALTDAMLGRSDVTPPTAALDNQPAAELEIVSLLVDGVRAIADDIDAFLYILYQLVGHKGSFPGAQRNIGHALELDILPALGIAAAL